MAENYRVKQGDCISSIAFEKGFFPDTIWNHSENKNLKDAREDPNVLLPGDIVHIPDKRLKEVSEPTNQVYKYKVKNTPAYLHLILKFGGEPLKNEPYILEIGDEKIEGKVDAEGKLRVPLSPDIKSAKLTVGETGRELQYTLDLGQLDPIDEIFGFKKRLYNLGYDPGKLDASTNDDFENAIRAFEADNKLEPTGRIGDENKKKLEELYGR